MSQGKDLQTIRDLAAEIRSRLLGNNLDKAFNALDELEAELALFSSVIGAQTDPELLDALDATGTNEPMGDTWGRVWTLRALGPATTLRQAIASALLPAVAEAAPEAQ